MLAGKANLVREQGGGLSSIYIQCPAGWAYPPTGLRTWVNLSFGLVPSQSSAPQPFQSLVLRCGMELTVNQPMHSRAFEALSFHPGREGAGAV